MNIFKVSKDNKCVLFNPRIHLPMQEAQEMWVQSLGMENLLQEEMATHSNILAWNFLWTEEPGGLQFMGLQRVRRD